MKTRLAEIIQSRGLERKQIASDLEIERRTLDNYINEYTLMHSDIIRKMAQYFNVSTDYLLGIDNLDDEFLNEKIDIITKELKEIFEEDLKESTLLTKEYFDKQSHWRKFKQYFSRLLSPIL